MSEESLQIAEKRREAKGKGKKERYTHLSICAAEVNRYTHLNAEFQRIVRKDKKDFFTDQCREIERNNRMRKARDLFKKN